MLHDRKVDYLLIGGVNFLLRHEPELTFDVDIWVADTDRNLTKLNDALRDMEAAWGPSEREWAPVPKKPAWLRSQSVYCLTTAYGALAVFREVRRLEGKYPTCKRAAYSARTAVGVPFTGLSDRHMLACQEALSPRERKLKRIEILKKVIKRTSRRSKKTRC